jgi:hypothetical protein
VAAISAHEVWLSLIHAGFTEDQAMKIVIGLLLGNSQERNG